MSTCDKCRKVTCDEHLHNGICINCAYRLR
jgi:hypothetical protein